VVDQASYQDKAFVKVMMKATWANQSIFKTKAAFAPLNSFSTEDISLDCSTA